MTISILPNNEQPKIFMDGVEYENLKRNSSANCPRNELTVPKEVLLGKKTIEIPTMASFDISGLIENLDKSTAHDGYYACTVQMSLYKYHDGKINICLTGSAWKGHRLYSSVNLLIESDS